MKTKIYNLNCYITNPGRLLEDPSSAPDLIFKQGTSSWSYIQVLPRYFLSIASWRLQCNISHWHGISVAIILKNYNMIYRLGKKWFVQRRRNTEMWAIKEEIILPIFLEVCDLPPELRYHTKSYSAGETARQW